MASIFFRQGMKSINNIIHTRSGIPSACNQLLPLCALNWNQERFYAARKGKRMKLLMKKKASQKEEEEVEKPFVPYKILLAQKNKGKVKKRSERGKKLMEAPTDNVYRLKHYKWIKRDFVEAIEMHRETHHPSVYNDPNALVYAFLELDLKLQKKNRFLDVFTSIVRMPHDFEFTESRKVLAICSREEDQKIAKESGASLTGGTELITQIQSGDIQTEEFHYVISTPDLLNELIPLRGVLKRKFPIRQKGTLTYEIKDAIDRFVHGIEYKSAQDPNEKEYGSVEIPIGRLSMSAQHLEENLDAAIKDVCTHRDLQLGPFVSLLFITSPPSPERIVVQHEKYMPSEEKSEAVEADDEKAVEAI